MFDVTNVAQTEKLFLLVPVLRLAQYKENIAVAFGSHGVINNKYTNALHYLYTNAR